jgi:hypothetical protein
MARGVLVDELKLPDETAWYVLQSSLAAAHACAQRIDQRAQDVFQIRNRERLRKIFARMAKCVKRLPASRRHLLDREFRAMLHREIIDSESAETLIETLIAGFGAYPRKEPSLTVLRAVMPGSPSVKALKKTNTIRLRRHFAKAADLLQQDYSALPAIDQRNVESVLTTLVEERRETFDTVDICSTLSRALATKDKVSSAAAGLITDYVEAVVRIWQQHGLRAGRATHEWDSTYRSKFHRFADLVLTSAVDPWSKRHDSDQAERLARLRKAHAELPEDIRQSIRATPPRSDVEWLVSEDHVKKALGRIQKMTPQTP